MRKKTLYVLAVLTAWIMAVPADGCTNFLCTKSASSDGSTMITYAADSHTRYGQLRYHKATDHQPGETLKLYNYGSLKFQIEIPQVAHTYGVVGFINDHQLAIGETTWGGIGPLDKGNAEGIDYGNLIYVALQRAKNCREAIKVMAELVETYGYADGGESFSLCDPNEVWLFEITSKGSVKGAVWVARRVPEGYVCGHANQARITTFPQEPKKWNKKGPHPAISSKHLDHIFEPEVECVYSSDVATFWRKLQIYLSSNTKTIEYLTKHLNDPTDDFSFADAYNPLTFSGVRACDARVWSMFRRVCKEMDAYEDYAMGRNNSHRLPLWVKPDRPLSVHDVMQLMRDHFEGTPMDMTQDVGAGPFHCPYRWRPMDWEYNGKQYIHERAISTQQTGFSFVAQCRGWLPDKVGGIIWFGVDDTYSTCYCPMYCGITQIPVCFEEGNGSMTRYSETAAFWLFNRVTNFCYLRYDAMIEDVIRVQQELEHDFIKQVKQCDERCANLNDTRMVNELNLFSNNAANRMMKRWRDLDQFLLVKYIDGNIKHEQKGRFETTPTGVVKFPQQPPYPDWFYKQIVTDHGRVIEVPNE